MKNDSPSPLRTAIPLHKPLQRVKLRQAEVIVHFGGVTVARLGPLPELTTVHAAGEHGTVLLRLMAKNGEFLAFQVVGADGYHPVNFVRCPFLPGATVEPDFELKSFLPYLTYGPEDGVGTNPVRAVWVGKIAGHVDLRRFEPLQQGNNVGNVLRMDGGLGNSAGPVKAEVHEFQMFRRDAACQGCRSSFGLPDQRFDLEYILRIGLSWLLGPQKTLHPFLDRLRV